MTNNDILREFQLFSVGGEGIGGWLAPDTDEQVFERLARLEGNHSLPRTKS